VIKYSPADAVLGLEAGEQIALSEEQFDRLSAAFFAELEKRFFVGNPSTNLEQGWPHAITRFS
jgi:hypothetical protein